MIHPDFQGLHLMRKLLDERRKVISGQATFHTVGLIATENLSSLANALRAGGWVIGLHHDAYCENFILYSGIEQGFLSLAEPLEIPSDDLESIRTILDEGQFGTRLVRSAGQTARNIVFSRTVYMT